MPVTPVDTAMPNEPTAKFFTQAQPLQPVEAITPRLCFIKDGSAYFTTQPLSEQDGPGWNKVPYDYADPAPSLTEVRYQSTRHTTPDSNDRSYSVRHINFGAAPWLFDPNGPNIYAGLPIGEFKRLIKAAGGKVWVEEK